MQYWNAYFIFVCYLIRYTLKDIIYLVYGSCDWFEYLIKAILFLRLKQLKDMIYLVSGWLVWIID